MTDPHADAYLTAQLDELTAATRDGDQAAADAVIARLIRDDHPAARQAIAGALRMADPDRAEPEA